MKIQGGNSSHPDLGWTQVSFKIPPLPVHPGPALAATAGSARCAPSTCAPADFGLVRGALRWAGPDQGVDVSGGWYGVCVIRDSQTCLWQAQNFTSSTVLLSESRHLHSVFLSKSLSNQKCASVRVSSTYYYTSVDPDIMRWIVV